MEDDSDIKEYLFSDPEYRDYSDLLHGTYIAALMRRKPSKKGGAKTKRATNDFGEIEEEEPSASTLNKKTLDAFQDAQDELKWESPDGARADMRDDDMEASDGDKEMSNGADGDMETPNVARADIESDFANPVDDDFAPSV
jgi:hypothetical protein